MKKHFISSFCLFLVFGFFSLKGQQTFKTTPTSVIGYLEYLPADYHSSSNNFPVVIFLHGMGEKGPNSNDPKTLAGGVNLLQRHGPPKHVKNGTRFPFILISPQLKSGINGWKAYYVMEVIEHVMKTLRIDRNRIYLTGMSMGGFGTWMMAQTYPDFFAAIAPICGGGSTALAKKIADANLPIWAFHGNRDHIVPVGRTIAMVNAVNQNNPNPRAKLTIYDGVRHNSWDNAYQPDHSVHNPNVYEWLMAQRKNNNSAETPVPPPPSVFAGNDLTMQLPENKIVLQGTVKSNGSKVKSMQWTKTSGGNATLAGEQTDKLTVSGLLEGEYVFQFKVKDENGKEAADEVKLTVLKGNKPEAPVAYAGADIAVQLPTNYVSLSGSVKATARIKSYLWTKKEGNEVQFKGETTSKLEVSGLKEGAYVFQFKAVDENGLEGVDDVSVIVKRSAANTAPVANAGQDRAVDPSAGKISITGSAADSDGKITSYKWTKLEGGPVEMSNTETATLMISGFKTGKYVFVLTVKDDKGMQSSDEMMLTVNEPPRIEKLRAYAGEDQTVYLPVKTLELIGGITNKGVRIVSYNWKQVAGSKVKMSKANKSRLVISGITRKGVKGFKLTIKDELGRTAIDHVRIIIKDRKSEMDNMVADSALVDQNNLRAPMPESKIDLAAGDEETFKNLTVFVFNDRGDRIYSGPWAEGSFKTVFSHAGFYIYHIIQGGQRIDVGKMIITQ